MATKYDIQVSVTLTEKDRYGKVVRSPVITWDSDVINANSLSQVGQLLERLEKAVSEE